MHMDHQQNASSGSSTGNPSATSNKTAEHNSSSAQHPGRAGAASSEARSTEENVPALQGRLEP